jgi:hypothetical protein
MGAAQDRESTVAEAVNEMKAPQRAAAIERLGQQPSGNCPKLTVRARLGQRHVGDVVGEIESLVLNPHRIVNDGRKRSTAKAGQELQPSAHVCSEIFDGRWLPFAEKRPAHVHVGGFRFDAQERFVQRR